MNLDFLGNVGHTIDWSNPAMRSYIGGAGKHPVLEYYSDFSLLNLHIKAIGRKLVGSSMRRSTTSTIINFGRFDLDAVVPMEKSRRSSATQTCSSNLRGP